MTTTGGSTVSVSQTAKVIETSEPQTLVAPKDDVELARNAKPVEVKPDPAPKQDVDALSSSIGLDLGVKGPLGVDASAKADARLAGYRVWDRNVRQWSPDWMQYDEYYRPIILNPYRERVRIVYMYEDAPRIVWIPPLARAVLEVAQFAAYSFTAVVDTALNVAVGTFFGSASSRRSGCRCRRLRLRCCATTMSPSWCATRRPPTSRSGCGESSTSVTTRASVSAKCCSTVRLRHGVCGRRRQAANGNSRCTEPSSSLAWTIRRRLRCRVVTS